MDHFDLLRSKHLIKGGKKFCVVIMEQTANGWLSVFEFPAELPSMLRDQTEVRCSVQPAIWIR